MECYATHLSLWRAGIYCGTLWVPLLPPSPIIILHPIWFSLPVVTTVVVPLLLSYFVLVKGVFSPVPPYCGYSKPSHSFDIMLIYLICHVYSMRRSRGMAIRPTFKMFELSPSSNIKEGVEEFFSTPFFMLL